MENTVQFEKLEKLLRNSRTIDGPVKIDADFKHDLREKIYREGLYNQTLSRKDKIRSFFLDSKIGVAALGAFTALFFVGFISAINYSENVEEIEKVIPTIAKVSALEGNNAQIRKIDSDRWVQLLENDEIGEGDIVKSSDSTIARIVFEDGSFMIMDSNTKVKFEDMEEDSIVISQYDGETYNSISNKSDIYTFKAEKVLINPEESEFAFKVNNDSKAAKAKVFKNKIELKSETSEQSLDEFKKGFVNFADQEIQVSEVAEEDYKAGLAIKHREEQKAGGVVYDENIPNLNVMSPQTVSETESDQIVISGVATDDSGMKKIVINGNIYMSLNESGDGFNPDTGEFSIRQGLKEGGNKFEIIAYDKFWNQARTTLTVNRKVPIPEVKKVSTTNGLYISNLISTSNGTAKIAWGMSGYSAPKGFKVVYSNTNSAPKFGQDSYKYVSSPSGRNAVITGLKPGIKYYFRVCIYEGGSCSVYSSTKTVTP